MSQDGLCGREVVFHTTDRCAIPNNDVIRLHQMDVEHYHQQAEGQQEPGAGLCPGGVLERWDVGMEHSLFLLEK